MGRKKTYRVYGINVSKDDERYEQFFNELNNNLEEDIFDLHELWCGLSGYIINGDEVVIGYANNVDSEKVILKEWEECEVNWEGAVLEFLGVDYNESQFQFYTFH